VRKVIDGQDEGIWMNSVYGSWLAALRALSAPTIGSQYPETMRTRPWAMKTLNTQLASWTELRHDTLLYAKQSYSEPGLCGYPAGFVEPRPEFWQSMKNLVTLAAQGLSALSLTGTVTIPSRDPGPPWAPWPLMGFDLQWVKQSQINFLGGFAAKMAELQDMAEKELAQEPFSAQETQSMKDIMELSLVYTGTRQWNGWYPKLFYANGLGGYASPMPGCDEPDPLVVDVHTDLPDPLVSDPGAVIHEAVGNVNLLLIAVDNGPDRMVYAGPVFSHYEFEMLGVNRLSDEDWKAMQKPAPPSWTQSFLAR
jgi:hypothetical protein